MDWLAKLKHIQADKPDVKPAVYTQWFYRIGNQHGYTRMGLMTADLLLAQKELEAVYSKPIIMLRCVKNNNFPTQ